MSVGHWLEVLKTTETGDQQWNEAVKELSSLGLGAIPALIEAMGNENPDVRRGASRAIRSNGPAIIPFMIKALRNNNDRIRESATQMLYGLAPDARNAIPALTETLGDPNQFVRQWAATALERMGHLFGPLLNVAIPGLVKLLRDDDYVVRTWAAHAIGSIGNHAESAIPALENAKNDEDSDVAEAATEAIEAIRRSFRDDP